MLVGIDFGTTYSCIHYIKNGVIRPFLIDNMNLIPSVIDIKNNAGLDINDSNVIMNLKSTLDTFGDSYIIVFFNYLYQKLKQLDANIDAVISVPANFDHHKRNLIKNTFEKVGIKVLRILNEPTASVLGYNTDKEKVLIIDIGAGTTDITYLEYVDGIYQIIKNEGNNNLGGNKITDNLLTYFKLENNKENFDKMEFIKKKINYLQEENLFLNGKIINQEIFEEINQDFINNFNEILNEFDDLNIDEILLVGGCCNSYLITLLIKSKFKNKSIKKSKNMQEIVSIGCCRYAGILMNELKDEIVLVDVVPLSLGVKLIDGTFSVIIEKNSVLPVTKTNSYTTDKNDEDVEIEVYQGENPIAEKNSLIAKVIYKNDSNNPLFKLTIKIDTNGLIILYVLEENSQKMEKYKLENIKYHKVELKYEEIDLVIDYEKSNLMKEKYQLKNILNNYLNHLDNIVDKSKNCQIINDVSEIYDKLDNYTLEEIQKLKEKYVYIPNDVVNSDFYNIENDINTINDLKEQLDKINNIIINYTNLNDNEEQYLKTNLEILQLSNLDEKTLRKQINLFENIKRIDYVEELNYLITYLIENLNDLEISENNKKNLLEYLSNINLSEINNNNSLAEITLNNLNKYCENLK
jgi:molecular chaperone DnaK (HSP70)